MLEINDESQYEKLNKLREEGETVWSISRLNNYNNCPYGYYLTYLHEYEVILNEQDVEKLKQGEFTIDTTGSVRDTTIKDLESQSVNGVLTFSPNSNAKVGDKIVYSNRGLQNIYSHAGGLVHDALEKIHTEEVAEPNKLLKGIIEDVNLLQLFDVNMQFPVSSGKNPHSIKENWESSMMHFANNFTKLPNKVEAEKLFVFEIVPGIYMQGYIDVITTDKMGNLLVLDWKTSSRFTGKKKIEAGRQLVLYKMAVEQVFGIQVDKVGWYMLKYARAYYGGRSKMVDRGKWVEQISSQLGKLLEKHGVDEVTTTVMLMESIQKNDISNLPIEVQEQVRLEPLIEYYKVTPELQKELVDYINTTVDKIRSDFMFAPNAIDYSNSFFCANLCGQRDICQAFQTWKRKEEEKAEMNN